MNIIFEKLPVAQGPKFDAAMTIYMHSFPANERQSIDVVKKRITDGCSTLYVALLDQQVVAMAMLFNIRSSLFLLLDYIAVEQKYRHQHIGSNMMAYIISYTGKLKKSIVVEIEHPSFGNNKSDRNRRCVFYLKNGFWILDNFTYILPSLNNTDTTEMLLMFISSSDNLSFCHEEIKLLIYDLYEQVYGLDSADPLLKSFINTLPLNLTFSKSLTYDTN